uniref:Uncharacterized protein n=2 Tax=Palpitomonas bilix TaxID=652834 RepID=A0A7S3DJV2_9EUKA|mmetsp:Transcript_4006/g.7730  ORF Transcript_4006/g.7730 Transcript_4006/m.7730 type:complete len:520 (+) Transcript_4006:994-2553(+)
MGCGASVHNNVELVVIDPNALGFVVGDVTFDNYSSLLHTKLGGTHHFFLRVSLWRKSAREEWEEVDVYRTQNGKVREEKTLTLNEAYTFNFDDATSCLDGRLKLELFQEWTGSVKSFRRLRAPGMGGEDFNPVSQARCLASRDLYYDKKLKSFVHPRTCSRAMFVPGRGVFGVDSKQIKSMRINSQMLSNPYEPPESVVYKGNEVLLAVGNNIDGIDVPPVAHTSVELFYQRIDSDNPLSNVYGGKASRNEGSFFQKVRGFGSSRAINASPMKMQGPLFETSSEGPFTSLEKASKQPQQGRPSGVLEEGYVVDSPPSETKSKKNGKMERSKSKKANGSALRVGAPSMYSTMSVITPKTSNVSNVSGVSSEVPAGEGRGSAVNSVDADATGPVTAMVASHLAASAKGAALFGRGNSSVLALPGSSVNVPSHSGTGSVSGGGVNGSPWASSVGRQPILPGYVNNTFAASSRSQSVLNVGGVGGLSQSPSLGRVAFSGVAAVDPGVSSHEVGAVCCEEDIRR